MKTPKPGQFTMINGILYRAKRRTDGCKGCDLDDITLCPNVTDSRTGDKPLECSLSDIILKKENF